jgi:hypothetical protein
MSQVCGLDICKEKFEVSVWGFICFRSSKQCSWADSRHHGVKFLQQFRDRLCPHLQGVAGCLVKPKINN